MKFSASLLCSGLPPELRSRVSCKARCSKGCWVIYVHLDGSAASNLKFRCAKHELQPLLPFLQDWVRASLGVPSWPLRLPRVELRRNWDLPPEAPPGAEAQHLLGSFYLATEAAWRANQKKDPLRRGDSGGQSIQGEL